MVSWDASAMRAFRLSRETRDSRMAALSPDALHLLQILHRGVQHAGEGVVPLHQGVGDGVGVPPGDGVVQQQLQGLVVRKALQPRLQKPPAHLLPVSVVYAHGGPPLAETPRFGHRFGTSYYTTGRPLSQAGFPFVKWSAAVFEGPVKLWGVFFCRLDRGQKLA